jgi:hypothetical protein
VIFGFDDTIVDVHFQCVAHALIISGILMTHEGGVIFSTFLSSGLFN